MTFYADLRNVASGLLREFAQGTVEIGRPVTTSGANEWSPPATAIQWQRINAVARGVSQKFVDGTNIVASDIQLTVDAGVWQFRAGDRIRIDGVPAAILRVENIPAAGIPVAYRVFARGGVSGDEQLIQLLTADGEELITADGEKFKVAADDQLIQFLTSDGEELITANGEKLKVAA